MNLQNIKFPIFPIRTYNKLYVKNKVLHIETYYNQWIIDNKNLAGDNLAKRRLRIPLEDRYPLSLAIFNISQLIKYKGTTKIFIDTHGDLIKYSKTKRVKIFYEKIIKYKDSGSGYMALWVKRLPYPIYAPKYYVEQFKYKDLYVGILKYDVGYLLFELCYGNKKNTWRKI